MRYRVKSQAVMSGQELVELKHVESVAVDAEVDAKTYGWHDRCTQAWKGQLFVFCNSNPT